MIGKLRGLVDDIGEDWLVVDVSGVGYLVHCSGRTLSTLPPRGQEIVLVIETYVREDLIRLYGFKTDQERELFRTLQTVQGVGAKVALSILGTLTPSEIATAISLQDKAALTRVSGVGPKVAERLITELKGKLALIAPIAPSVVDAIAGKSGPIHEATSALVNLGYSKEQAATAVGRIAATNPQATVEHLIRAGLRELAS